MNPEVGGLLEWDTRVGNEEGEMYAGRRNPKDSPKYHLRERAHTGGQDLMQQGGRNEGHILTKR